MTKLRVPRIYIRTTGPPLGLIMFIRNFNPRKSVVFSSCHLLQKVHLPKLKVFKARLGALIGTSLCNPYHLIYVWYDNSKWKEMFECKILFFKIVFTYVRKHVMKFFNQNQVPKMCLKSNLFNPNAVGTWKFQLFNFNVNL